MLRKFRKSWPVVAMIGTAAATSWFALFVWRSPHRNDLAAFWSFVAAIVTIALGLLGSLRTISRRDDGDREKVLNGLADSLAEVIKDQWTRAAADRRLLQPEPILVRWGRPSRPMAGTGLAATSSQQFPPLPGLAKVADEQLREGQLTDLHSIYGGLGSGRLVVAGPPGSGKSSAAVLLLLAALNHREQVSAKDRRLVPVPVLFTFHGWNPVTERVEDWLASMLQQSYPLFAGSNDSADAVALINTGRIAVILDGLDEMPEQSRPVALRSLSRQALFRLVILTRSAEMAVAAQKNLLLGAVALELRAIDAQAAADYLTRVQLDPAPHSWRELTERLRHDTNGPLAQALSSPLALTLIRDTYHGGDDIGEFLEFCDARDLDLSPQDIEDYLLDRVLPAAYDPIPGEPRPRYELHVAQRALSYIAVQMILDNTRDLAWWRVSTWAARGPRTVATSLVIGPITGLLAGLAIGEVAGRRGGIITGVVAGHGTGLVVGLIVGIGTALWAGPVTALVARASGWEENRSPRQIASLQWRQLLSRTTLTTGLLAGLIVGLGFGLRFGIVVGLATGLGFALGAWLVSGLVTGLSLPIGGGSGNSADPSASWQSDKAFARLAGVLAGLLTGILSGVAVGIVVGLGAHVAAGVRPGIGLVSGVQDGLIVGCGVGLSVGLGIGLTYPETWSSSLAFAQLAVRRNSPLHLMRFLEDAHQRGVLRAVGPIYQFRHARLQDRLAGQTSSLENTERQAFQAEIVQPEPSSQLSRRERLWSMAWVWVAGGLIAVSLTPVAVLAPVVEYFPSSPSTISAEAISQYTIRVTWTKSSGADGYNIDNGCPVGTCQAGATLAKTTGPITATEFSVTPGTYQCFEVEAFNRWGISSWSPYGCTSTPGLFVPGMSSWIYTGVNVPRGIVLGITAAGTVFAGGPENGEGPAGNHSCIPYRDQPGKDFLAPRLHCWSLIARIGNGAPFEIGDSTSVTATAGRLYLGVNDSNFLDNSGGWLVNIKFGGLPPPPQ
jgi:hypothetical protein